MSIANKGSIFDKVINEEWFHTPDMGEYWNNAIYKKKADEQSEVKGKTEFFVENPPTEIPGYHNDLEVIAVRANPKAIHTSYLAPGTYGHENHVYDGDTIKFSLDNLYDTSTPFQLYYTDTIFQSVHHYLKETLNLNAERNMMSLRFVGINTPEILHYGSVRSGLEDSDTYTMHYEDITSNKSTVIMHQGIIKESVNIRNISFAPYKMDGDKCVPRTDNEITFVRVPATENHKEERYFEVLKTENKGDHLLREVVVACEKGKNMDYYKASLDCRDIVEKAFAEAEDAIFLLDVASWNKSKSDLPEAYKKSFEKSTYNPFYSLYDIWKSAKNEKAAYKYSGYRVPGQEANGRFLSAIYLKNKNGWINLNKKILYENNLATKAAYSDSVDDMVNDYWNAKGFKLWTYDKNNQLYIDSISQDVLDSKDDRKEIQKAIAGCDLEEMTNHTVMIGDCLFMIPPTSIRAVSQTKTSKTHLIRAKGSMAKTLPKTERIIQMDLFFNTDEGINGYPYKQKLPNGSEVTYMMNGLRALIAQFKLTPFLPIHNSYINDVLNITAVSLSSYTISTVPNYPRTLQVSLTMQEFDWVQYMPCQAVPENTSSTDLYRNGFSETIHFPLLRFYYQKALQRGDDLKTGDYSLLEPNSTDYIEQTIGNKTVLQPMAFTDPLIDFYIPNKTLLAARKQAIIEMRTRPLGKKFNFTDKELRFIYDSHTLYNFLQEAATEAENYIGKMTDMPRQDKLIPYLDKAGHSVKNKSWIYEDVLNGKSPMIVYGENARKIKIKSPEVIDTYIKPAYEAVLKTFNKYRTELNGIITHFDIKVELGEDKASVSKRKFIVKIYSTLSDRYFDDSLSMDKMRQFCGKKLSIASEDIFKENEASISFVSHFENTPYTAAMSQGFYCDSDTPTLQSLSYLASLTDSEREGNEDLDIDETVEELKDSIDIETSTSIKFERFEIGNPIITSISSSYNNIFANMSLKAIDGHAAQYTGGTDSSLEIEMIADELTVGQLYYLNRLCVKNLIEYRKVMKSSPLRIDSDLTRMLGIHEVIIESLDVSTIPDTPGRFNVIMRLSSVDRTIRNKESLKRIKGIDNASTQKDMIFASKNYFDLNKVLSQAELYPDLELPTYEELEKAGFYFMQRNYEQTRKYPDPDFYFLYWYPTFAESLRTSIIEIFENPEDFNYTISDDFSEEVYTLSIKLKDGAKGNPFKVLDWNGENNTYNTLVEELTEKGKTLYLNGKEKAGNTLGDKKQAGKFGESASRKIERYEHCDKILNKMQEAIDNSVYNTYQVNTYTNVTVKDVDILDVESDSDRKEKDKICKRLKEIIIEELMKPIVTNTLEPDTVDPYDVHLAFKPLKYETYKGKTSASGNGGNNDSSNRILDDPFYTKIAQVMLGREDSKFNFYEHAVYISQIVKAVAIGNMADEAFFNAPNKHIQHGYGNTFIDGAKEPEPNCYPPKFIPITTEDGKQVNAPIYLYCDPNTSEVLVAHDEETRKKSIIFGRYGIRKYSGEELMTMFQGTVLNETGFLDPYYNANLASVMFGEDGKFDKEQEEIRLKLYRKGIAENLNYASQAVKRQMLVWLYVLIEQGVFINMAHYHAGKLIDMGENADKFWDNEKLEELSKSLYDEDEETFEAPTAWETVTNAVSDWRYKDEFDQLLGEGTYENMDDIIDDQEERIKKLLKDIQKNAEDYAKTLVVGTFYSLGAILMSSMESSIFRAICSGDVGGYSNCIMNAIGSFTNQGLTEEQMRLSRFAQYLNYFFEEEDRMNKNEIQNMTYNNRIQRAYLKAANEPGVYMLHAMYDMVMNDKRGSMARAFPTYYMLLIDEGRQIGLWKLQDHFYDMNSIVEFEVVKSRKIAADTARITMTNLYGTFNTDDSDQKDEFEYTMRDVWDSIFTPRPYFQKEYMRRKNSRDVNTTKMQPGARVHLRAGYGADASSLPIMFNGCVTEFEAGELMTLVCQGDGVELANPHMFNPMDGKDVQNIKHTDEFFGLKQIMETWDNLSTPRDLLVLPLAAEGSWLQEQIRAWSNGRFFNSNPFGIVHFGDRKFNDIFQTNGEVEQNIYESLGRPTWNYEECGMRTIDDGLEKEYSVSEAPRVKVSLNNGTSYWDIMHIAASLSPDFICAVAPFQMRSTIFHGAPRYYYAYDYMNIDGKIVEKRKPFQQYHVYTSYSDIIDNRISTSSVDVRTNAVGHYVGPGWLSKKPKTVGPLFADIDIFPEYQKSTSVNLNFEYKNNDILPFNIPIVDKVIDDFDWTEGPNGEKVAWRATASALRNCMKEMYQGELIVMGDPSVKPYDKITIADSYEDITGSIEVEQVVHMFSVDTGFTTSITPDFVTAIDNKWETTANAVFTQTLLPSFIYSCGLIAMNLNFHAENRALYLSIARAAKIGQNVVADVIDTALVTIGKSELQRDALLINSNIDNGLMKKVLGISDDHIKFADVYKDIVIATKRLSGREVTGVKSLMKVFDEYEKLGEIFDDLSPEKFDEFVKTMNKIDNKNVAANALKDFNFNSSLNALKGAVKLNVDDLADIAKDLEKIDTKEAKAVLEIIKKNGAKGIDLATDEGRDLMKALRPVISSVDDLTEAGLAGVAKVFGKSSKSVKTAIKAFDKVDDVGKLALAAKAGVTAIGGLVSFIAVMAIELCITKGVQNFLTNKLRNLQVLTMYPLKKDGMVWTAGLNGHQGSVVGSPAYDQEGWLESMAIKFFDMQGVGGFIRDVFISTDEMKEIVNGYKRNSGYQVDGDPSDDKIRVEQSNALLSNIAKNQTMGYVDYKKIYDTKRLTLDDISNRTEEAVASYAFYKIGNVRDIERTSRISDCLNYIFEDTQDSDNTVSMLYKNDCMWFSADISKHDGPKEFENGVKLVEKNILKSSTDKASTKVYIKEVTSVVPKEFDIPYLRPDAMLVLDQICERIAATIQPDYTTPGCKFEKLKKNPIIVHGATRVNSTKGWRSTGFLFTFEVKNYNNLSNIIEEIELQREDLMRDLEVKAPFTIKKETKVDEYGGNAYTVFVHCPLV